LYEALRERARAHGKSIAVEVISLLEEGIPTRAELAQREKFLKSVISMRSRKPASGPFRSAEKCCVRIAFVEQVRSGMQVLRQSGFYPLPRNRFSE
jgi:hypothetical protein